VRVNVLSPGPIDTPIAKKSALPPDQAEGVVEMLVAKSLLKRIGTSDEVARAARFLLSEDSSNITGTELIIDGGVSPTCAFLRCDLDLMRVGGRIQ
jgi:NAD(P)-dependent dehydrogenase (short-subunit alcohol dehydrogenase family)